MDALRTQMLRSLDHARRRSVNSGYRTSSGPISMPQMASVVAQFEEQLSESHFFQRGRSFGVKSRRNRATTSMPIDFISRYGSTINSTASAMASSTDQRSRFAAHSERAKARMGLVP